MTAQISASGRLVTALNPCTTDSGNSEVDTVQAKVTKSARARMRKIQRMAGYWPALFSLSQPKPIKTGIIDDLLNDLSIRGIVFGKGSLKAALASYTRRYQYQAVLSAGGARYDINGKPCGEVTPEQQIRASANLGKSAKGRQKHGQR